MKEFMTYEEVMVLLHKRDISMSQLAMKVLELETKLADLRVIILSKKSKRKSSTGNEGTVSTGNKRRHTFPLER